MFASGVLANSPNSANASAAFCSAGKKSDKLAMIRAAKEISRVSTSILKMQ